jgi:ATP-dependent Clp protease adaptor protein ClpS
MPMSQSDTATKIQVNHDLKEPPLFKVIYLNDDQTSMEFVVGSLIDYFSYDTPSAAQITESIHNDGSAVVAVLPFEIAEQKGVEVTIAARNQNYPLQLKLEPDTA